VAVGSKRATRLRPRALRPLAFAMGLLPPGMGQYAVARTLIGRWPVVPPALITQHMVGGAVFELDLSDRIQAEAFLVRRYAVDVVDVLANRLASGQVFFDIGANVGLVTFSVGARVPGISIHAFEPHPANVARWRRNRSLNRRVSAIVEPVALGDRKGSTRLHVTDESGSHYVSESPEEDGITVPMMTLDEYAEARGIETVHALKLDVEGHEPLVLNGGQRLLREGRIGCIVCELNDFHLQRNESSREAIIETLRKYGFTARPVPPFGLRGRLLGRRRRKRPDYDDYVFVPE
jgi:FkbM family methyltransferase